MSVVAVIGAGKLGGALARRALAAGHTVRVAGRDDSAAFRARVAAEVPGAQALPVEDAVDGADLVVLALPLAQHRRLDPTVLAGHVVVDAMNDWPAAASPLGGLAEVHDGGSSVRVQRHLPGTSLVKALNHIGYHDLDDEPLVGAAPRRGLALAGDDPAATRLVADFLASLGFDPVDVGPLARGASFALGTAAFTAPADASRLRRMVGVADRADLPVLVAA